MSKTDDPQPGSHLKALESRFGELALVIAAITTVLKKIAEFQESWREVPGLRIIAETPWGLWLSLAGITLLVGVALLVHGRTRRSRLAHGVVLRLDPDREDHLVGRGEDVTRLVHYCRDHALVYLQGESGAGKSAMVRTRFRSELRQNGALVPIYINVYGQDWEKGPRCHVSESLWDALKPSDEKPPETGQPSADDQTAPKGLQQTLGLTCRFDPDNLKSHLENFREKVGRTPLLIFDQYDDYVIRHRDRFVPTAKGAWLTTAELTKSNKFWREIRDLVRKDLVHCLFVTRTDTGGLTCLQFVDEPREYPLGALQPADVHTLLTKLTTTTNGIIVHDPADGWKQLQEQLVLDLQRDGTVLPARLNVALNGLRPPTLKYLTVRAYAHVGGLAGLEAADIERHVSEAEKISGLRKEQVRELLLALVDRAGLERGDKNPKTIARSEEEVLHAVQAKGPADTSQLQHATDYCEKERVIRPVVHADTGHTEFVLDHDYRSNGVLEADRRANRWRSDAEDANRRFQQAKTAASLWRQWQALLPPGRQIALWYQRLRGKFDLSGLRSLLLWSLLTLVPYFALLAAVGIAGVQIVHWRQTVHYENLAHVILREIGHDFAQTSEQEVERFFELARSPKPVRLSFLRQALEPGEAVKFNHRMEWVVQATVGINPDVRQQVIREIWIPQPRSQSPDVDVVLAWIRLGMHLDALGQLSAEQAQQAFGQIVAAMQKTKRPDALRLLAEGLKAVPGQLSAEQAQQAFGQIVAAMQKTTHPDALRLLAEGLKAVPGQLSAEQAQQAFGQIVAAMQKTTNPFALGLLAEGLKAVPRQLSAEQAQQAVGQVVAAMQKTTNPDALRSLGEGLKAVPGQLSDEQAQQAVGQIVAAMQKMTNPDALRSLAEGLKAVAGQLSEEQAQHAFGQIVAAMQKTTNPFALSSLAEGLKAVPGQLSDEQAQQAFGQIVAAMQNTTEPYALRFLAEGLKAVAGQLSEEQAQHAFGQIVAAMQNTTEPYALRFLAEGLKAVPGQLSAEQAQQAFGQIVAAMQKTTNPFALGLLAEGLKAVPGQLSAEQAQQAVGQVVAAMQKTTNPDALRSLGEGLKVVPWQLSDEQAQQAVGQIVAAMQKMTNPDALRSLAEGLKAVAGQLSEEQAQHAFGQIVAAMQKTTNPFALSSLAEGLKAVPGQLLAEQAQQAVAQIVAAMQKTTDPFALRSLAEGLKAVPVHNRLQLLIDLLKLPTCHSEARGTLIELIEQQSDGQKFAGSVWKLVEWAETRMKKLDVRTPPPRAKESLPAQ